MNPNPQNLERLFRRIVKGLEVPVEEVFFHWKGLGSQAERLLIQLLNKLDGWEQFLKWVEANSGAKPLLESVIDLAGVPEKAVKGFSRLGFTVRTENTSRSTAQWIQRIVQEDKKEDWERARELLDTDLDLLEGVLPLLESLNHVSAVVFLDSFLKTKLSEAQNQLVRKSLYRLKQKGLVLPEEPAKPKAEKDFIFLGENRIALWQPVMLFRYSSSLSDSCDLYMIRLLEGRDISTMNQQRGLRVEREGLKKLVSDYSKYLQQDIGVYIPFQPVSLSHGRHFLKKSIGILTNEEHLNRLKEFLQLVGTEPSEDPFHALRGKQDSDASLSENPVSVLDSEYFLSWAFYPEDFQDYLSQLEKLQEGPIILTDHQVQEMSLTAASAALTNFLEGPASRIWSFAFEKAAFFLGTTDPENSRKALRLSEAFLDPSSADRMDAARVLMGRMVGLLQQRKQAEKEEEKKGSVILSPQEFSRRYPQR